jgi:nitroreductase
METPNLIEVIKSRRSVRRFLDKPVKKEHLEQILDAARFAPSGGNLQGWRFIVIQNTELIKKIELTIHHKIDELHETMNGCVENSDYFSASLATRLRKSSLFFPRAPITIAVLYKANPLNKPYLEFLMKKGFDRHDAHKSMGYVEIQSAAAATENLLLAAHSLGYGGCWMNVPFIAVKEIKDLLDISHPWEISALVPIGHPDPGSPLPKIYKKRLDEIVIFR